MSAIDEFLAGNQRYAAGFDAAERSAQPAKAVAIVACMDARFHVSKILGLEEGDAHILRNAGGVITDDVIRSLAVSQRLLGTREIMVIHHTGCGMTGFSDDEFRRELERETSIRPPWTAEAFADVESEARQSLARIAASPFIPHKAEVRAFVYETDGGRLREVAGS